MARRRIELEIVGDASQLGREFNRAARQAQLFNARITGSVRGLSRGLGFAGATAGIAGLGLAIRSTVDAAVGFESSFAGVRKTVDATEPQFRELAEGFRAMSREIPVAVDELNRIGESAGQLGIQREAILDFTETVAALGVTTNLSSEQAADSLARLANIVGTPQSEFENLGSTVVDLGNKLAATESEILEFGLRIAGAGRQVGLNEAQILAIGGAFSSVGVEAERGGTAVSKVLLTMNSAILDGGENLQRFANVANVSATEFRQAFEQDAGNTFLRFVEGLDAVRRSGGNTFQVLRELGLADSRLISAFQAMSAGSDVLSRSLRVGEQAFEANNALTEEAAKRYGTTASRLQVFQNRVNDLQISLGNALIPALEEVVTPLSEWLASTENQERVTKELTAALTAGRDAIEGIAAVVVPLSENVNSAAERIGGLDRAVELLLVTMVAGKVVSFASAITGIGVQATTSAAGVNTLRRALLRLGAIGVIAIAVELVLHKDDIDDFVRGRIPEILGGKGAIDIPVTPELKVARLREIRDNLADVFGPASEKVKELDRLIVRTLDKIEKLQPQGRGGDRPGSRGVRSGRPANNATARARQEKEEARDASGARVEAAAEAERQAKAAEDAKQRSEDAFARIIESFELQLDRESSIEGDLKILRAEQAAIRRRMGVVGRTLDLQRQELDVEQQIADLQRELADRRRERRQGRQFEALGLTSGGEERVAGAGALSRRVTTLREQIKGTALDTDKTRSTLRRIARVLAGDFGKVGRDVRSAIQQMLADITGALDDSDKKISETKFVKRGAGKLLEGLGLTPEQEREFRQRFAQLGPGSAPGSGFGAFGFAVTGTGSTAAPSGGNVILQGDVYLDADKVGTFTTRFQQKQVGRNATTRRGTRAGR